MVLGDNESNTGVGVGGVVGSSTLGERLQQREQGRLIEVEKRKQERQEGSSSAQVSSFKSSYASLKSELDSTLTSDTITPETIETVNTLIQQLKKLVSDSMFFLPAFDQRRIHEDINGYEGKQKIIMDKLKPRKKFGFKAQAKTNIVKPIVDQPDSAKPSQPVSHTVSNNFAVTRNDLTNTTITINADEIHGRDVLLERLENCKVTINGIPSTLHIAKINKCTITCCPVATSVMIHNCTESNFAIACQQLRVHNSEKLDLYLYISSRVAIENCTELRLAPYPQIYFDSFAKDFEFTKMDFKDNHWNRVDDFDWLVATKPSPHWSVLKEEERKDWMEI